MDKLVWVHEDALGATHPVWQAAGANTPAVFVWDNAYFQAQAYSFKRLVFIYECLQSLPVRVIEGDSSHVLAALAPKQCYSAYSPNPVLQRVADSISAHTQVIWVEEVPFVTLRSGQTPKRFFGYWKRAEHYALMHNGGAASGGEDANIKTQGTFAF